MTRDEVARECDKLGWTLESASRAVEDLRGPVTITWWNVTSSDGRSLACRDTPREAYLEACKREGKTPF